MFTLQYCVFYIQREMLLKTRSDGMNVLSKVKKFVERMIIKNLEKQRICIGWFFNLQFSWFFFSPQNFQIANFILHIPHVKGYYKFDDRWTKWPIITRRGMIILSSFPNRSLMIFFHSLNHSAPEEKKADGPEWPFQSSQQHLPLQEASKLTIIL